MPSPETPSFAGTFPIRACAVAVLVVLGGCASKGPLTVEAGRSLDPPSCLFGIRGRLIEVVDKRGYSDPANIGFTQTGFSNTQTSLIASPPPAVLLRDSLGRLLETCATYGDKTPTPLAFRIGISTFNVTESTGWKLETMKAEVAYTVQVFTEDGKSFLASFDVDGSAQVSVETDTTDFAKPLVDEALRTATSNFMWRGVEVFRKYGS